MRFLQSAEKVFDRIGAAFWVLSGAILLFSITSVIVDVVFRLLYKQFSLPWVVEVNEYLLFALTFLSSVWCLRRGGHIRIDFIYELFSQRKQAFLSTMTSVMGAAACLLFSVYGGYATWFSYVKGTHFFKFLKVPKYAFTLVICICAFMLAVEFVLLARKEWTAFRAMKESSGEGRA
ncbi:MAG: TRAP transporter small permease [Desulfobacteraceae bacterium]